MAVNPVLMSLRTKVEKEDAFKESTGQSPYHYVVEVRVRKAKDLLTTGKFTISEAAYHVGFVDQSHLTRHFKRVFGLPPKTLLSRIRPESAV
jgi:AraC family transcriptional regulator